MPPSSRLRLLRHALLAAQVRGPALTVLVAVAACRLPASGLPLRRMGRVLGYHRATLLRAISALERAGLIEVSRRQGVRSGYRLREPANLSLGSDGLPSGDADGGEDERQGQPVEDSRGPIRRTGKGPSREDPAAEAWRGGSGGDRAGNRLGTASGVPEAAAHALNILADLQRAIAALEGQQC